MTKCCDGEETKRKRKLIGDFDNDDVAMVYELSSANLSNLKSLSKADINKEVEAKISKNKWHSIDRAELKKFVIEFFEDKKINLPNLEANFDDMLKQIDSNNDGRIEKEEFVNFMWNKLQELTAL